jgi:protein phosphatase
LSGQVSDEELGVILGALPPSDAVHVMVDLANLRGGPDNITAIVARVTGTDPTAKSTPALVAAATDAKRQQPARIHPLHWAVLVGLVLAVLALINWGRYELAIWTAIAALAAGLSLVLRNFRPVPWPKQSPDAGRFGRGPHTSCVCSTNNEFVDKLAKVVQQLHDAASDEEWIVDWDKFAAFAQRAQSAAAEKNYVAAVREYCRAISFMMQELRRQRHG